MATETREDIPLKKPDKKKGFFNVCNDDVLGGSRFINTSFASLTVAVTIALFVQIYYGDYQVIPHGSVATDSKECSIIGTEILKKGGNAIDAAIASSFCLCVVNPHTTSLDGQGEVMIYDHFERKPPAVITFNKNYAKVTTLPNLVVGLAYLHLHYSRLSWSHLIEPSIRLATEGFQVSRSFAIAIRFLEAEKVFGALEEGDVIKMGSLGTTLRRISSLTDEDLRTLIIPSQQPEISTTINGTFGDYTVHVPDGVSGGPILLQTLKQLEQRNFTNENLTEPEYVVELANITKTVYQNLNISDLFYEGTTSNVAVIDHDELYVSLVMGLHAPFGSRIKTDEGFLLDVRAKIQPSSRFPVLITDTEYVCGRRIVFGPSDYVMAFQIVGHLIIGGENVTTSIEAPRFDVLPDNSIGIEDMRQFIFNKDATRALELFGRVELVREPYNSCNIVEKYIDDLSSHSDSRGGGLASRF